jgi:hypothetical protein
VTATLPNEPVLNKQGMPVWLCYEKNDVKLKPSCLWSCYECGTEQITIEGKPQKCTNTTTECKSKNFTKVTDAIEPILWILSTWINYSKLDMKQVYKDMIIIIKKLLVFPEEIHYKIFVLWIISTWKLGVWDVVSFLAFIGIPSSGKSRALDIIRRIAYRAVKASGVTSAAIPRLCHYHQITLLVDEAHNKLNPRRTGGSELLDFVKDSYKRGSTYITCDKDDPKKVIVTKNFGFKAFASEKNFEPGLLSRSISFWMEKEEPEIAKIDYLQSELESIHSKLLNYRFKSDDPPDLGNDFALKGRTREIYECIIATGRHIDVDIDDIIAYAKNQELHELEELQNSSQYDILHIIKEYKDSPPENEAECREITLAYILSKLEWESGIQNEDRKAIQRLGYLLKHMGLQRKRTNRGRAIPLYEEPNITRLEKLMRRYGLL